MPRWSIAQKNEVDSWHRPAGAIQTCNTALELLLAHDSGSALFDLPAAEITAQSAKPVLAAGSSLGKYRILEHLGSGGMGTVYKATDTKLGRQVALKLLRPEVVESSGGLARFEREARVLASLNNPRVGAIYDFEEQDGMPFLALEYVKRDLRLGEAWLRRYLSGEDVA
jgi:serine/threonine protein kinase